MTCPRCDRPLLRDGTCLTHGEPSYAPVSMPITPRAARPHWSEAERRRAIALASDPSLTGKQKAAILGREYKGWKHQLARMGIKNVRGKSAPRKAHHLTGLRPKTHWSDDEIVALESNDVTILIRSRGKWAVIGKAKREGCPLRSGDGCYSLRQVSAQYGVRYPTVHGWVGRGLLPAKRSGDMWRIEPAVADRVIPILKKATRANHGRKGWWTK